MSEGDFVLRVVQKGKELIGVSAFIKKISCFLLPYACRAITALPDGGGIYKEGGKNVGSTTRVLSIKRHG